MSCCALLVVASLAVHGATADRSREEARLLVAAQVLDELRGQRDQLIPQRLLQRAYGVAVIPSVTKVALVLGGRRGSGVMVVRDSRGHFSSPIFINLTGASVGLQWGAQETDIVLVFTTRGGVEGVAGGKLTLGVGASVAAGPVGRQAEAAAGLSAEVYAYSRSRGLFAGIALDGTSLSIGDKSNDAFYGRRGITGLGDHERRRDCAGLGECPPLPGGAGGQHRSRKQRMRRAPPPQPHRPHRWIPARARRPRAARCRPSRWKIRRRARNRRVDLLRGLRDGSRRARGYDG